MLIVAVAASSSSYAGLSGDMKGRETVHNKSSATTLLMLLTLSACAVNIEEEIKTSPEGVVTQAYISSALQREELSSHYGECASERDRAEGRVFWKEFGDLAESLKDVQFIASSGNSN